ncbi:hypothetical protein ACFL4W_01425 [Planctomycetota bacterium]
MAIPLPSFTYNGPDPTCEDSLTITVDFDDPDSDGTYIDAFIICQNCSIGAEAADRTDNGDGTWDLEVYPNVGITKVKLIFDIFAGMYGPPGEGNNAAHLEINFDWGTPRNLVAVAGDAQVDLAWEDPHDMTEVSGYILLRREGSAPEAPVDGTSYGPGAIIGLDTVVVNENASSPVNDASLTNGDTYYYAVYSYDAVNGYAGPSSASATPVAPAVPVISVEGDPDLGPVDVGSYVEEVFTITNSGNGTLQIDNITFQPGGDTELDAVPPLPVFPPSQMITTGNLQFTIRFTPSSAADFARTIVIQHNAGADYEIDLTGRGIQIEIDPGAGSSVPKARQRMRYRVELGVAFDPLYPLADADTVVPVIQDPVGSPVDTSYPLEIVREGTGAATRFYLQTKVEITGSTIISAEYVPDAWTDHSIQIDMERILDGEVDVFDSGSVSFLLPIESTPTTLDVAVLLDRSGSMSLQGRWEAAISGAHGFAQLAAASGITANYRVGLYWFCGNCSSTGNYNPALDPGYGADYPGFMHGPFYLSASDGFKITDNLPVSDPDQVQALSLPPGDPAYRPRGCTALGSGLLYCRDQLEAADPSGTSGRVILALSDGMENSGPMLAQVFSDPGGSPDNVYWHNTLSTNPPNTRIYASGLLTSESWVNSLRTTAISYTGGIPSLDATHIAGAKPMTALNSWFFHSFKNLFGFTDLLPDVDPTLTPSAGWVSETVTTDLDHDTLVFFALHEDAVPTNWELALQIPGGTEEINAANAASYGDGVVFAEGSHFKTIVVRFPLQVDGQAHRWSGQWQLKLRRVSGGTGTYALGAFGRNDGVPPADVSELMAASDDGKVSLSWLNPLDPDFGGVMLLKSAAPVTDRPIDRTAYAVGDAVGAAEVIYSGTGTSHDAIGLANGSEYFFKAFSRDRVGNFAAGVSAAAIPADIVPPMAVTDLTAVAGNGKIELSWTNPGDSDFKGVIILRQAGYPVVGAPVDGVPYIAGDMIGEAMVVKVGGAALAAFSNTGLENGQEYFYEVFARDGEPNYSAGAMVSQRPVAPEPEPEEPQEPEVQLVTPHVPREGDPVKIRAIVKGGNGRPVNDAKVKVVVYHPAPWTGKKVLDLMRTKPALVEELKSASDDDINSLPDRVLAKALEKGGWERDVTTHTLRCVRKGTYEASLSLKAPGQYTIDTIVSRKKLVSKRKVYRKLGPAIAEVERLAGLALRSRDMSYVRDILSKPQTIRSANRDQLDLMFRPDPKSSPARGLLQEGRKVVLEVFPYNSNKTPLGPGWAANITFECTGRSWASKDEEDGRYTAEIPFDQLAIEQFKLEARRRSGKTVKKGGSSSGLRLAGAWANVLGVKIPISLEIQGADLHHVRVILKKIRILDAKEGWFSSRGEIAFNAHITPNSNPDRAMKKRIPEKGYLKLRDDETRAFKDLVIFDGYVKEGTDLDIVLGGSEFDWRVFYKKQDKYARYHRKLTGPVPSWAGKYVPGDEKDDPEALRDWQLWYTIEVS